ncbi:unnamed protein product [Didymodactylos carnosus]|uniref:Pituitary tumor-transforming gene 1 protein-interacting protein n=1 Tax=Didymodactylos carnosus TaxID=1234261 RepID=A0A815HUV4_9BILA|nr:unnamed protein product [Didymodactylos carnosus]CAF1520013.1 unnamed protein product [Didymodactylos carnosus]CAF4231574.1 unnamed protein product [Didymodactylos carnosus]CAF4307154.1 unnamed protein product [Didymodactylos carnosus]
MCSQLNESCTQCIENSKCAYCKKDGTCGVFKESVSFSPKCGINSLYTPKFKCKVTAQTLLIIGCSIGAVVLIAIGLIIWCMCRRCGRCAKERELKREDRNRVQMEQRKQEHEVRVEERKNATNLIRLKYGM